MKVTSILSSFLLAPFIAQAILCAEVDTDPLERALAQAHELGSKEQKSPVDTLKVYIAESKTGNVQSMCQATDLLLRQYCHFEPSHFQDFLTIDSVVNFLQSEGEKQTLAFRKILLAISAYHGWGHRQDPALACNLLDEVKGSEPTGAGHYLSWEYFETFGHLSSVRRGTNIRFDATALKGLIISAQMGFPPAIKALQRVSEFSSLLINNQPLSLSVVATGTSRLSPLSSTWRSLADLTQPTADHFYYLTAITTLVQKNGIAQNTLSFVLDKGATLMTCSSPNLLEVVFAHVNARMRADQIEAAQTGVKLFVNFTTLQNSDFERFFVPLTEPPLASTPEQISKLPIEITQLKGCLEGWCDPQHRQDLTRLFEQFTAMKLPTEQARTIARLKRVYQVLLLAPQKQPPIVHALIDSCSPTLTDPFAHALVPIECSLIGGKKLTSDDIFLQLVIMGLAQMRTAAAISLSIRADHKGSPLEANYYGQILKRFSLVVEDVPLVFAQEAHLCMKPLHAALAFLKGYEGYPGWGEPQTYIDSTYTLLKMKPRQVVNWLKNNMGKCQNIALAFQDFVQQTPSLKEAELTQQLRAFVTTQERAQEGKDDTVEVVKKEFIPYLLLDLHILETTPDYK